MPAINYIEVRTMENETNAVAAELDAFCSSPVTLDSRRQAHIERRAISVRNELLVQWAACDEGALPTFADAVEYATRETDALCEALGDLVAVPPHEAFPRRRYRPRRGE